MNKRDTHESGALRNAFNALLRELGSFRYLDSSAEFVEVYRKVCDQIATVDPAYLPGKRAALFKGSQARVCYLARGPDGVRKTLELMEEVTRVSNLLKGYTKGLQRDEHVMCLLLREALGEGNDGRIIQDDERLFSLLLMEREGLAKVEGTQEVASGRDIRIVEISKYGRIFVLKMSKKFRMRPVFIAEDGEHSRSGGTIVKRETTIVRDSAGVVIHGKDVRLSSVSQRRQQETLKGVDSTEFARQIGLLLEKMTSEKTEPAHNLAIGAVVAAKEAAESGDKASAARYLKSAGEWALKLASGVTTQLAEKAISGSLNF